jgi:deazaflavin-dependent oxidoreductase (nitroreductase family)
MAETREGYNARLIQEFRASSGRVGGVWESTPLLLLHHQGARSGRIHVSPLAYLPDAAGYLVWAANGGAPSDPAWYRNLKTRPLTEIEVDGEMVEVAADEVTGDQRDRLFDRAAARYPSLGEMARQTPRVIPLMLLRPVSRPQVEAEVTP